MLSNIAIQWKHKHVLHFNFRGFNHLVVWEPFMGHERNGCSENCATEPKDFVKFKALPFCFLLKYLYFLQILNTLGKRQMD